MKKLIFISVLCAACTGAFPVTGNQALELMTGSSQSDLLLTTYTAAVFDQEMVVRINAKAAILKRSDLPVWPFCPPVGVNPQQGAAVLRNALRSDPANNHDGLIVIARRAFTKAWECKIEQLIE